MKELFNPLYFDKLSSYNYKLYLKGLEILTNNLD